MNLIWNAVMTKGYWDLRNIKINKLSAIGHRNKYNTIETVKSQTFLKRQKISKTFNYYLILTLLNIFLTE